MLFKVRTEVDKEIYFKKANILTYYFYRIFGGHFCPLMETTQQFRLQSVYMGFAFEISKLVKNYTPLLNIIAKTITIGKLLKKKT